MENPKGNNGGAGVSFPLSNVVGTPLPQPPPDEMECYLLLVKIYSLPGFHLLTRDVREEICKVIGMPKPPSFLRRLWVFE
jgi:hypothetical protein